MNSDRLLRYLPDFAWMLRPCITDDLSRPYLVSYSIGSSLMMEAPWLFPIQNVGGLVELSTSTLRTFVVLGSKYSIDSAV